MSYLERHKGKETEHNFSHEQKPLSHNAFQDNRTSSIVQRKIIGGLSKIDSGNSVIQCHGPGFQNNKYVEADNVHFEKHLAEWQEVLPGVDSVEAVRKIATDLFYSTKQEDWKKKGPTYGVEHNYKGVDVILSWGLGGIVTCYPLQKKKKPQPKQQQTQQQQQPQQQQQYYQQYYQQQQQQYYYQQQQQQYYQQYYQQHQAQQQQQQQPQQQQQQQQQKYKEHQGYYWTQDNNYWYDPKTKAWRNRYEQGKEGKMFDWYEYKYV